MTSFKGSDSYNAAKLGDALGSDPRVNALGLEVSVQGTSVYITGDVPTEQRRAAVSEVAQELLPHCEIHNQTKVTGHPRDPVAEELT